MLKLSKKLLFAIEAVLDIAYNAGARPVQAASITKRQGIPKRYLEQVLQALVRAGILAGQRGPKGGYRLAKEAGAISVADIVRIVRTIEVAPIRSTGHRLRRWATRSCGRSGTTCRTGRWPPSKA